MMLLNGHLVKIKKTEKEIKMNSYDIQVELGINTQNSSIFTMRMKVGV